MGESKRRKEQLGDQYGQAEPILPWLPMTQEQSQKFMRWTTTATWTSIILVIAFWITLRFIGPGFGWWDLAD
jgi:fatty acid desaturase